jgi:hypothetical protein
MTFEVKIRLPVAVLAHCDELQKVPDSPTSTTIRSWRVVVEQYTAIFIDDDCRWFLYQAGVETEAFPFDYLHGVQASCKCVWVLLASDVTELKPH